LKPAIPVFLGSDVDVEALLPWARKYMILSATFYFPLAVLFICRDAMQGCGYGFLPLMGGVLELVARVVMAVLSIHFGSYILGVAGDPAAWVVTGVYGVFAYIYVMHDVEKRYHLGD
jgi:Na+-driven multidrug efflux pump